MRSVSLSITHRVTFISLGMFLCGWIILYLLSNHPPLVKPIQIHCSSSERERMKWSQSTSIDPQAPRVLESHQTLAQNWSIISWDLGELKHSDENIEKQISTLIEQEILKSTSDQPLVIMLQGVNANIHNQLNTQAHQWGGCWLSASLASTSSIGQFLEQKGIRVYQALLGSNRATQILDSRSLWIGVYQVGGQVTLKAERWSLPAQPGRWPLRWFSPQSAALMLSVRKNDEIKKFVNLKLPDAKHKHQAGALALRELQRPPLSKKLDRHWLIIGDWRVTPPQTPKHPEVGFRFQRFSLEALYADSQLKMSPPRYADPQKWGRWRSISHQYPEIIDYALSDSGNLKLLNLNDNLKQVWVGTHEQRAPLMLEWNTQP